MFNRLLNAADVSAEGTFYIGSSFVIILAILGVILSGVIIYLIILLIKACRKYLKSSEVREEKKQVRKSLGETLKEQRIKCNMKQEFVAEALGVSRQAVSKWETGYAEPSTSNLLALAKLYGVSAEELLKNVSGSISEIKP
ncbi:MAG: helix-turn-helix domain-containing protein [Clostridia bacterium]|nr:helix-turn-helix domain-containing protein [Clostridia bacterium]